MDRSNSLARIPNWAGVSSCSAWWGRLSLSSIRQASIRSFCGLKRVSSCAFAHQFQKRGGRAGSGFAHGAYLEGKAAAGRVITMLRSENSPQHLVQS